ncbi:type I polyketide synthase [Paenibacillus sp. BR2-3]|uniref:type I polyketide synthase n=1 Tax=Paenibacillus sp. BR2-3 TaxID=3048494 RepID=UPI0039772D3F
MSNADIIKQILQQIKDNQLDAKEGLRRINVLKQQQTVPNTSGQQELSAEAVEQKVKEVLCRIIQLHPGDVNLDISFKEMGVDSISSVEIVRDLNDALHIHMDGIQLYDYPTIPELARYILKEIQKNNIGVSENLKQEQSTQDQAGQKRLNHRYEYMNDLIDQFSKSKPDTPATETNESLVKHEVTFRKAETAPEPAAKKKPGALSLKSLGGNQEMKTQEQQNTKLNLTSSLQSEASSAVKDGIAIIGISGRFPGASTPRELWRNLRDGVCSTGEIPGDRFDIHSLFDEDRKAFQKTYCKVAGLIDSVDEFDPLFFNISPKEAEIMDPQQRIFLEEAWKALEDAGYSDLSVQDTRCGVFVGCAPSDYTKHLDANRLGNTAEAFTGTSSSILAARISYFLNLKGPSISLDTACSSSLVAVHQACMSLWSEECDMALAGGIRLMFTPDSMVQSSQMEILSAEGVCRPFDNAADGTLLSEGVGIVVLKPLEKALQNRDHIYGVIRGTGVNQDGRTNGITAPSVNSQIQLEKAVYEKFRIDPADINYVEAHGTGTTLGDPIEVKALTESFREFTKASGYCALGSIKANIGHATMAAGVAGIIKVVLALKSRKIPPLIHYEQLNEKIRLDGSPFYINTDLIDWPENKKRSRMAAVSGFGFSGTNCHVVIEEYKGGDEYRQ